MCRPILLAIIRHAKFRGYLIILQKTGKGPLQAQRQKRIGTTQKHLRVNTCRMHTQETAWSKTSPRSGATLEQAKS